MLADLAAGFPDLVHSWCVSAFDHDGPNYRLKARIVFRDGSVLHVRQVVLDERLLRYSYHWCAPNGTLLCRWDNAPHWPDVTTAPHHKHAGSPSRADVKPSRGGDLQIVMEEIAMHIRGRFLSDP